MILDPEVQGVGPVAQGKSWSLKIHTLLGLALERFHPN